MRKKIVFRLLFTSLLCCITPSMATTDGIHATDNVAIQITHYGPTILDVLANGDDFGPDGAGEEPITFTQAKHGKVSLLDGGTPNDPTDDKLIYEPKADVHGVKDSFNYMISSATGDTSTAKVTLDIISASTQVSDGVDALGTASTLLMMLLTLVLGLSFVSKKEEDRL